MTNRGKSFCSRLADVNRIYYFELFSQWVDLQAYDLGHQPVTKFVSAAPAILTDRRPGCEALLIDHQRLASQAGAGNVSGDNIHGGFDAF